MIPAAFTIWFVIIVAFSRKRDDNGKDAFMFTPIGTLLRSLTSETLLHVQHKDNVLTGERYGK